jgi:hypothetical protein
MVLSAVYGIVAPWWSQPGWWERPLGQLLKVCPTDVAESAMRLLRMVGFLPPEVAQPEE